MISILAIGLAPYIIISDPDEVDHVFIAIITGISMVTGFLLGFFVLK